MQETKKTVFTEAKFNLAELHLQHLGLLSVRMQTQNAKLELPKSLLQTQIVQIAKATFANLNC